MHGGDGLRQLRKQSPILLLILTMGCADSPATTPPSPEPRDLVLGMLDKGILHLTINIERASRRMDDLLPLMDTSDELLQELRAMDLLGLTLHQQQWTLQRTHLSFARAQLDQALENPTDKSRLLVEWVSHERQYERDLASLRQKRFDLEQKRQTAEAQFIERAIR